MFAAPYVGEGQAVMPSQRQWNAVLRLFGALLTLTGVAVTIAVMVMSNMNTEGGNRFPWEGVLLFSVGLVMVLFSLYYTDPEVEGRRGSSEGPPDMDLPPSYWEVCNQSSTPSALDQTSVTSGRGDIVITISRVKSTFQNDGTVNNASQSCQPSDEEPDEPLPKYEDVVDETERRNRTSTV